MVNSVTSNSVNLFSFVIYTMTRKCCPTELDPRSDAWWSCWCQPIHMTPGLQVSSIPQWKLNCHNVACHDLFQAMEQFEPPFIEDHKSQNIIWNVRSLKSRISTHSILEEIKISWNEVFEDVKSDISTGVYMLGKCNRESVKGYNIVQ